MQTSHEEGVDDAEDRSEKGRGYRAAPNILELRNAIADSAKISGEPRRRHTHKLPRDHPAHVALEEAISQRSLESNQLARYFLQQAVYRCRRRVRALTGIAQAEFFLSNPRAPRRKKTVQQMIRGLELG